MPGVIHAPVVSSYRDLSDAVLDLRVALADADDAYEAAVYRATQDRIKSKQRARARWDAACGRAREAAEWRRSTRRLLLSYSDETLRDILARVEYTLSPVY